MSVKAASRWVEPFYRWSSWIVSYIYEHKATELHISHSCTTYASLSLSLVLIIPFSAKKLDLYYFQLTLTTLQSPTLHK